MFLLRFILTSFFFISLDLNAYSVIIYGADTEQLDEKATVEMLMNFTGPKPLHFLNHPNDIHSPEYEILFTQQEAADALFIQRKLKEAYPTLRNLHVQAIPTTLWDLTTLCLHFNQKGVGTYFEKSALIGKFLSEHGQTTQDLKIYAHQLLEEIKRSNPNSVPDQDLREALVTELAQGDDALIMKELDAEIQAIRENKFHVIRATEGCKSQQDELLDSPICAMNQLIQELQSENHNVEPWFLTREFSFSTSLLAGAIFDGYNKLVPSACTFERHHRQKSKFIYSLALDRKWILEDIGNTVYFQKSTLYTDGILGSGEEFHPRITFDWSALSAGKTLDETSPLLSKTIKDIKTGDHLCEVKINNTDMKWSRPMLILLSHYILKVLQILNDAQILASQDISLSPDEIQQNHQTAFKQVLALVSTQQPIIASPAGAASADIAPASTYKAPTPDELLKEFGATSFDELFAMSLAEAQAAYDGDNEDEG